jgi:predicted RNA binding protein YcfA (HicA-like mRNA interferase family)
MANFPAVSGKQAVRALQRLGFRVDRIEGSHYMMVKDLHPRTVASACTRIEIVAKWDARQHHSNGRGDQKAVF